jgi:hypothetical protein
MTLDRNAKIMPMVIGRMGFLKNVPNAVPNPETNSMISMQLTRYLRKRGTREEPTETRKIAEKGIVMATYISPTMTDMRYREMKNSISDTGFVSVISANFELFSEGSWIEGKTMRNMGTIRYMKKRSSVVAMPPFRRARQNTTIKKAIRAKDQRFM